VLHPQPRSTVTCHLSSAVTASKIIARQQRRSVDSFDLPSSNAKAAKSRVGDPSDIRVIKDRSPCNRIHFKSSSQRVVGIPSDERFSSLDIPSDERFSSLDIPSDERFSSLDIPSDERFSSRTARRRQDTDYADVERRSARPSPLRQTQYVCNAANMCLWPMKRNFPVRIACSCRQNPVSLQSNDPQRHGCLLD
jgi:hypothetical protein